MVRWNDPEIYDEGLDEFAPKAAVGTGAGLACMVNDCFGFFIKNKQIVGEELVHLYRNRQTKVDKRVGSGEGALHEQRVYAYRKNATLAWTTPQDIEVSAQAVGILGTDYKFIGWFKEDAAETDETVLINWDGTRPDIGY
jgi:hypothetical protein